MADIKHTHMQCLLIIDGLPSNVEADRSEDNGQTKIATTGTDI
jgi:hypothetical protein